MVFCCFQGAQKGNIEKKWIKYVQLKNFLVVQTVVSKQNQSLKFLYSLYSINCNENYVNQICLKYALHVECRICITCI